MQIPERGVKWRLRNPSGTIYIRGRVKKNSTPSLRLGNTALIVGREYNCCRVEEVNSNKGQRYLLLDEMRGQIECRLRDEELLGYPQGAHGGR
jgi:hypothetical protein